MTAKKAGYEKELEDMPNPWIDLLARYGLGGLFFVWLLTQINGLPDRYMTNMETTTQRMLSISQSCLDILDQFEETSSKIAESNRQQADSVSKLAESVAQQTGAINSVAKSLEMMSKGYHSPYNKTNQED